MIVPALLFGGYEVSKQVKIGCRPGGRTHNVDAIARKNNEAILVSLKWQQTSGTAEQKVPFEIMCLADAIRGGFGQRAYLVLGGEGWTLREYFTSGGLKDHLLHADLVRVRTLESFVTLANGGNL